MKSYDREIKYCDSHLLVVVKQAGEVVQPMLHEEMRGYIQKRFHKPGRAFLEPIHRLDKPVRGLVIFARTSKALSRLNESMRNHEIEKTYLARVEGYVEKEEATLEHFLRHGAFKAQLALEDEKEAKRAILSYRVMERSQKNSLLEVKLKTGRYHQIRAQLSLIGHPILGDAKYGSQTALEQIALEHVKVIFLHPVSRDRIELTTK